MKKYILNKILFFITLFVFFPFSASAFSVISFDDYFYISPKYFINKQENSFHAFKNSLSTSYNYEKHYHGNTYSGGALAIGIDFYDGDETPIRAELEFSVYKDMEILTDFNTSKNDEENFKIKENTVNFLFLNAYYDFYVSRHFIPYLSLGLDFSVPAGQIGLGFAIKIKRKIFLDIGYSYLFSFLDNKFFLIQDIYGNKSECSLYNTQKINLALRFVF